MKTKTQKKSVFNELGSISDEAVSLGAALAMGFFLVAPGFMALMAMFKQNIDFTMNIYLSMIKHLVFPTACAIVLIVYIIVIIRLENKGATLGKIFRRNPTFVIFMLSVLAIVASQFYVGAQYALTGYCAAALGETFGMEICYFIFILFGATQIKVEAHKRVLLRIQLIVSMELVLAAFILWHTQETSTFFSDWTPRFSSIFSNTNYYGYYLAISVPIAGAAFVYEKKLQWKIVAAAAFITNTIALSLDDTMGAWVACALAVVFIAVTFFIVERKVNWQTLILIPVFIMCLYIPGKITGSFDENMASLTGDVSNIISGQETESVGSGRGRIWSATMDIVYENSVFGIGFEGVKAKGYVGPPYNIRPHNEFMQYALFHGIPMAILYFAGCLAIFIRALRKKRELNGATLASLAGAFGYLVSSFFGLTVFSTAYFLFIFLGMGYVNESYESADTVEKPGISRRNNVIIAVLIVVAMAGALTFAAVKAKDIPDSKTVNLNDNTY